MLYVSAARFRSDCARLRWLAYVTAACIVFAVLLSWSVPVIRGDLRLSDPHLSASVMQRLPDASYVAGIVFIGQALGRLSGGRPVQPILATALRRVGWAIGVGGAISVFIVPNVLRVILGTRGGYLLFDVGSMTLAIIGGALVLLGHVVDQAVRVQDEMDQMF